MSRTSEALIHLRSAMLLSAGSSQLSLRDRVIDSFKRLIPASNILAGAKAIFYLQALQKLNISDLENMKRFFFCLQALDVRSKADFVRITIDGLNEPPRDRPESKYADRARYLLENVFGCKFAYDQQGQLIIGKKEEVEAGLKLKIYSYTRKEAPIFAPIISAPSITNYQPAPSQTTALAKKVEVQAIAKKELRLKAELKQAVIDLLESGQPELASTVLFSNPERSVYENLALIEEIIKERSLFMFDDYENLPAAIKLHKDLQDTGLIRTKNNEGILLLAYLLGRYASVAPVLAAKVIDKMGTNWLGMTKEIDFVVDVFAFMEKDEYRANAIQGLTALGSFKLVDRIIQTGLDESHALYHDRFGGTLDLLKGRDGDLFLSHAEYQNRSVFRRKPEEVEIKYYSNGESGLKVNDFQDIAEHKQKMVMAMSPDAHLRTTIRELLRKGQDGLAAQVAFSGYYDIAIRLENLAKLGFQNLGRLLGAMEEDKRIKIMIEMALGLEGEEQQKAGEEVALAMLWLGGEKSTEKAAAYYHQLVVAEAGYPGARFAARKLMLIGSLASHTAGDYGLLYDDLEKNEPAIFKNDHHLFVKTDGCLAEVDAPIRQANRQKYLTHYFAILKNDWDPDNKLNALHMLVLLEGIEHLDDLIDLAKKITEPELAGEIFSAIALLYACLKEQSKLYPKIYDKINSRLYKEKWLAAGILHFHWSRIVALGSKAVPLFGRLLNHPAYEFSTSAAEDLGHLHHIEAAQQLLAAIMDRAPMRAPVFNFDKFDDYQRGFMAAAIEGLGNIGHPLALGKLKQIVESVGECDQIRTVAVKAIGEIIKKGHKYSQEWFHSKYDVWYQALKARYIEYLKKITLEDPSEADRREAVKFLLSEGEEEFEFVVNKMLGAVTADAVKLAAQELLNYKERAIPLFRKMLGEKSHFKRAIAADSLLQLGAYASLKERRELMAHYYVSKKNTKEVVALGEDAVPILLMELNANYFDSINWVFETLAQIGGAQVVSALIARLKAEIEVNSLHSLFGESFSQIKAVWALGEIGDPAAVPVLRKAAKPYWNRGFAKAAKEALYKIRCKKRGLKSVADVPARLSS